MSSLARKRIPATGLAEAASSPRDESWFSPTGVDATRVPVSTAAGATSAVRARAVEADHELPSERRPTVNLSSMNLSASQISSNHSSARPHNSSLPPSDTLRSGGAGAGRPAGPRTSSFLPPGYRGSRIHPSFRLNQSYDTQSYDPGTPVAARAEQERTKPQAERASAPSPEPAASTARPPAGRSLTSVRRSAPSSTQAASAPANAVTAENAQQPGTKVAAAQKSGPKTPESATEAAAPRRERRPTGKHFLKPSSALPLPQKPMFSATPKSVPESLDLFLAELKEKSERGVELTAIERHLRKHLGCLERGLFAPSVVAVGGAIASSLVRPLILASVFLALFVLPEKSSLAVFPQIGEPNDAGELASAFLEDHHVSPFARPEARSSLAIPDVPVAATEEVRLPILREVAKIDEAPRLDAPALRTSMIAPVEPAAALVIPNRPRSGEANGTPERGTPSSTDRRSLVKFISGLIAAFRPQLPDSGLIARHIVELSASERVDPLYVAAVIAIESRFSTSARSGVGATGLMQLMPMTAGDVAERNNFKHHARHLTDPRMNIQLGIRYLKELEQKYRGNRYLALAAYNWGPANVDQTHGRDSHIPFSVRKYSRTILERTSNWRKHFAHANESAELIADVSRPNSNS